MRRAAEPVVASLSLHSNSRLLQQYPSPPRDHRRIDKRERLAMADTDSEEAVAARRLNNAGRVAPRSEESAVPIRPKRVKLQSRF